MSEAKFMGWVSHKGSDYTNGEMKWEEFKPKEFKPTDIEMKVLACGLCHSDSSTAGGGWSADTKWPLVVGHEIVGIVTRVGDNVKNHKVGDRVGVGAQSDACLKCRMCVDFEREPNCEDGLVGTYNALYKDGSGQSQGGYASHWRGPGHFALAIPEGLATEIAAPLMCGGITAYAPLAESGLVKKGSRVGVVGLGGIGHFGIVFAKALGAEQIVLISRSDSKKQDALALGATDVVAVADDPDWEKKWFKKLDFVLVTQNDANMPLDKYIKTLRPFGKCVCIGIPEKGGMQTKTPLGPLLSNNAFFGGSAIGGTKLIAEMLQLAADKKDELNFMINKRKMSDANATVLDFLNNKARYRYVFINEDDA